MIQSFCLCLLGWNLDQRQLVPLCFLHICYRSPLKLLWGKRYNRCSIIYLVYYSLNGKICVSMCEKNTDLQHLSCAIPS